MSPERKSGPCFQHPLRVPQRRVDWRIRLCSDFGGCVDAQSTRRKASPQAEPDHDRRKHDQIAAADDEALQLESWTVRLRDDEARNEIQRDDCSGGPCGRSPAPAYRGRKEEEDEEQEVGAGVALG